MRPALGSSARSRQPWRGALGQAGLAGLVFALTLAGVAPPASALCGDGVFDAGESCDDGNLANGDCCSSTCALQVCSAPPQPAVTFAPIGPTGVGGRVTALAVEPAQPLRVLAGTPASGLWQSDDGGATWVAIAPWLDVAPVSAIAIDPANPDRWQVATGILQDSGAVGDAIGSVRTADAGASWGFEATPARTAYTADVIYWPGEPTRLLAATDRGLLLSTDGGAHLIETKTGDSFTSVRADPFDLQHAYASGRKGLYTSTDRGASWTLASEWPGIDAVEGVGVATAPLSVSPSTPGLLRAAVQDLATFVDTDRVLLLESSDGGASWRELSVPAQLCPVKDLCGFANALAEHPSDPGRLLLGGDRLFASFDGGSSWSAFGPAIRGVHAIVATSSGAVVAGRFGVAVVDVDWNGAAVRNEGLAITQIVSLEASPHGDGALLAATRDGGTLLAAGDPLAWSVVFGANEAASEARFDPFDPAVLYAGGRRGAFFRSDDGGASFAPIQDGIDLGEPAVDVAPIAPNPLRAGHLYTGRMQLFDSVDRGDLWSVFRPPGAPEIATIAPSPHDDDRVYFGLRRGAQLFKGDGIHTEGFVLSDALDERITTILPDPELGHTIYVGTTNDASQAGALYRTTDFGASWEDRSFGKLPGVTDVVKDRFGTLYAATRKGLYRSSSEGFVWSPFGEGLPSLDLAKLALGDDVLYAGTRGRGVYRLPIRPLVAVDSIPPEQWLVVDGVLRRGPFYGDWPTGSDHTIAPYLLQTADTRQEFVSWSDGGAQEHFFTATGGNDWPTVAVRVLHRLTTQVSPPDGGTLVVDPLAADGFHPFQSLVQLEAVPRSDHRIAGWSGDTSSVDRLLAAAKMDRPRSITALFEPLRIRFHTEPEGLALTIDGVTEAAPRTFQWAAGSLHPVSAPAEVDLDPADALVLAFDHWSDQLPRVHDFEMRSETFTADVTAHYVPFVPHLAVPAEGTRTVRTLGTQHARREASLVLRPAPGVALPPSLQLLRGVAEGSLVFELALPRSRVVTRIDTFVEGRALGVNGGLTGDGRIRRTKLAFFNPGASEVGVDLVLHAPDGSALAGGADVVRVPPGASRVAMLDALLGLPKDYEGALSVDADAPVAVRVLAQSENLRELDFSDPILWRAFDASDEGVPASPRSQPLLATPDTEHAIVLLNPGNDALAGRLEILDRDGAPLAAEVDGVSLSSVDYALAAGAHRRLRVRLPGGAPGSETVPHARIAIVPTGGGAPRVQAIEERTIGDSRYGPQILARSLPPASTLTQLRLPVDLSRRDTGLVVANPSPSPATLALELWSGGGAAVGSAALVVPPGAQRLVLASELFPAAGAAFHGQLRASADQDVDVAGFTRAVNTRGEEVIAGVPALDPAPGAPDQTHVFAYAVDGDTFASEWWLLGGADADLDLRDAAAQPRFLPMEAPSTP